MKPDSLMVRLIREYKEATRALRRLMEQDDTVSGFGARFDDLLDRCRELRLAIEQLEREGNDEVQA